MTSGKTLFLIPDGTATRDFRRNWALIRSRLGEAAGPAPEELDAMLGAWTAFWFESGEAQRECAVEDILMTAFFALAEACAGLPDPGRHLNCIHPVYRPGLLLVFALADFEVARRFAGDELVDFDALFASPHPDTWQEQFGRMLDRCARRNLRELVLTTAPPSQGPPPWRARA